MRLYLDDVRTPPKDGKFWAIARSADEAISFLKTGKITFASLDHDLADEHYPWKTNGDTWYEDLVSFRHNYPANHTFKEKTGYSVILWMEENNVWPVDGVCCHSMNPAGVQRIEAAVFGHYDKNFPIPR